MSLVVDNELVEDFQPLLMYIARQLDPDEAEDLVQLAWVRILEDADKYVPDKSAIRKWIGRVGYTAMLNYLTRNRSKEVYCGPIEMRDAMTSADMLEASPEEVYIAYEKLIELFEEAE